MKWIDLIDLLVRINSCVLSQGKTGSARIDIVRAAKALALSEPMAIFCAGYGKS